MKCIFDIGNFFSIFAKVTQMSDVAHGPLVYANNPYPFFNLLAKSMSYTK
jgi:hypothetical protein